MTDSARPAAQQLTIKVEGEVLNISIGVGLLAFAIQGSSQWPHDWQVSSPAAFAKELAKALEDEEEDGTTRVHRMLDDAAIAALESGGDGVEEGNPNDGLQIAKNLMGLR